MAGKTVFVEVRFVGGIKRIRNTVCLLVVIIYIIVNNALYGR